MRRLTGYAIVMAVLAISAADVWAQGRPGGGFGGQDSLMGLLGMQEVRSEIKTTDDENAKLDAMIREHREKLRASFSRIDFQNLSADERRETFAKMQEQNAKITEEADAKLLGMLEGGKIKRLRQLQVQRQGSEALNNPRIIAALELSDVQVAKIKGIQEVARPRGGRENFRNLSAEERTELFQKMRDQRVKAEQDAFAVLTDTQKEKWSQITGPAFAFPPQRGFGGGLRRSQ